MGFSLRKGLQRFVDVCLAVSSTDRLYIGSQDNDEGHLYHRAIKVKQNQATSLFCPS